MSLFLPILSLKSDKKKEVKGWGLFSQILIYHFFTPSIPHSLADWLTHLLTQNPPIHSLAHSLEVICSLKTKPPSLTHSFAHSKPNLHPSLICSLKTHSLTHELIHSLINPNTYSLARSLTHFLSPSIIQCLPYSLLPSSTLSLSLTHLLHSDWCRIRTLDRGIPAASVADIFPVSRVDEDTSIISSHLQGPQSSTNLAVFL